MADALFLLASGAVAAAEHGAAHAEPSALGLTPVMWVALSMATLIAIAIFVKVPSKITAGLDASIVEIRKQLEEAKSLRAEAEALRKEYADRIANAEKEAASMLAHARSEAEAIVVKAEADTTDVIGRREKMAEAKIAAAELGAVTDLRNRAAAAAAAAAASLIASNHNAKADKALVDETIGAL